MNIYFTLPFFFLNTVQPLLLIETRGNGNRDSSKSSHSFIPDITECQTQTCDAPEAPVTIALRREIFTKFFYH